MRRRLPPTRIRRHPRRCPSRRSGQAARGGTRAGWAGHEIEHQLALGDPADERNPHHPTRCGRHPRAHLDVDMLQPGRQHHRRAPSPGSAGSCAARVPGHPRAPREWSHRRLLCASELRVGPTDVWPYVSSPNWPRLSRGPTGKWEFHPHPASCILHPAFCILHFHLHLHFAYSLPLPPASPSTRPPAATAREIVDAPLFGDEAIVELVEQRALDLELAPRPRHPHELADVRRAQMNGCAARSPSMIGDSNVHCKSGNIVKSARCDAWMFTTPASRNIGLRPFHRPYGRRQAVDVVAPVFSSRAGGRRRSRRRSSAHPSRTGSVAGCDVAFLGFSAQRAPMVNGISPSRRSARRARPPP